MRRSEWVPENLWEAYAALPSYVTPDVRGRQVLVRPKNPQTHTSEPYPIYWDPDVFAFLARALVDPDSRDEHCVTETSVKHLGTGNVVRYFTFGALAQLKIVVPSKLVKDTLVVVVKYPDDRMTNDLTQRYGVDGFTLTYFLLYANNRGRS